MAELRNTRLIKALLRQPVDCTPVWMMRQAGRYLPEYRELRSRVPDFMTFCKTTELAVQVTVQPLTRFDLDAAIVFSDILTIPAAMGCELEFVKNEGPVIHNPIRSKRDVAALVRPDMHRDLGYVMDAIRGSVQALAGKVPLIGFAGSPWTVATYMVEGESSKLFHTIKTMMYREPDLLHALLTQLAEVTAEYLNAQIEAGADVVMLFDSWGGVLTKEAYQQFSLQYMQRIAEQLTRERDGRRIPIIFFTKNGGQWLELIAEKGCDAVGLDWTADIADARSRVGDRVALQGNLDPSILFSNSSMIEQAVESILQSYGNGTGHIFNVGHGINKETPITSVDAMIKAVRRYGKAAHAQSSASIAS